MLSLNTWTITYVAKVMLPTSQNFYEGDMSKYREYWTPVNTLYTKRTFQYKTKLLKVVYHG